MKLQQLLWLCGEGACPQTYERRMEKKTHADTAIGSKVGKKLASSGKIFTCTNGFMKQAGDGQHVLTKVKGQQCGNCPTDIFS